MDRIFTLTPPEPSPTDCPHMPLGGFSDVWRDAQVYPRLGCATDPVEPISGTEAYLCCTHSVWVREWPLCDDSGPPDAVDLWRG
jgi:hypothetical protein